MRVAILETGAPPSALATTFGTYATMTRDLLGPGYDVDTIRVAEGESLPAPDAFEAYVVTGSAAGAYDPLPWISALEAFLRDAAGPAKLVGICFGHQIMAQAFGGHVAKAPQGWALGLHHYDIGASAPWMQSSGDEVRTVRGIASHQDQVLSPPPGSRTLASSAFTEHAILDYGEQAISFQFHPEFSADFARALFAGRQTPDEVQLAAAIASLDRDNTRVAGWIGRFLRA